MVESSAQATKRRFGRGGPVAGPESGVALGDEALPSPVAEERLDPGPLAAPPLGLVAGSLDTAEVPRGATSTRVRLTGWALLDGRPAAAVLVIAQGSVVGALTTGISRPDVAEIMGSGAALHCGFSGAVDLAPVAHLAGGNRIEMKLCVLDERASLRGVLVETGIAFERLPEPDAGVAGGIDASFLPTPLTTARFTVTGWASVAGRPAPILTFWVGDIPVGACTTGLSRPDLPSAVGKLQLGTAGFSCPIDLSPVLEDAGAVALRASVSDGDGLIRGWLEPVTLDYSGPPAPRRAAGQIDHWRSGDRVGRGPLRVYGWATVPGSDVAAVAISLNGRIAQVVAADIPRPELASVISGGSLDVGFDTFVDLAEIPGDEVVIEATVLPADFAHTLMSPDALALPAVTLELAEPF